MFTVKYLLWSMNYQFITSAADRNLVFDNIDPLLESVAAKTAAVILSAPV
jgi:hypothetical protein